LSSGRVERIGHNLENRDAEADRTGLGQRIRKLRMSKGVGVRELARRINVSPSLISHIELGKGAPSVKTLYALVAALGIPLPHIFIKDLAEEDDLRRGLVDVSAEDQIQQRKTATIHRPESQSPMGPVLRAKDRRTILLEHGFRWERLTPGAQPDAEFLFIETIIEVGGAQPDSEMKTRSGTEFGVVLQGKLGIKIAFDTYILEPRDSIRFDSGLPHCLWNAGDEPTRSIWVMRLSSTG
jgi:transcriptional regulator with XRE-family HTH domain